MALSPNFLAVTPIKFSQDFNNAPLFCLVKFNLCLDL